MIKTNGYAAPRAGAALEPFSFDRRDVGARDVLIDIQFCGVCHSDIHQVRDEWGGSIYPMVPGHEIVGRVSRVGGEVTKFKEGDIAGIGCFVDSCGECGPCTHVIDEDYALKVDATGDLAGVAPLLCAGITTYSPLKRWGAGPGKRVAVAGLG